MSHTRISSSAISVILCPLSSSSVTCRPLPPSATLCRPLSSSALFRSLPVLCRHLVLLQSSSVLFRLASSVLRRPPPFSAVFVFHFKLCYRFTSCQLPLPILSQPSLSPLSSLSLCTLPANPNRSASAYPAPGRVLGIRLFDDYRVARLWDGSRDVPCVSFRGGSRGGGLDDVAGSEGSGHRQLLRPLPGWSELA